MHGLTPTDIVRRRRARRQADSLGYGRGLVVAGLLLALVAVFVPTLALAGGAAGLLAFVADLPDVATLADLPTRYQASTATTRLYAYAPPDADGLRRPVVIDEIVDPRRDGAGWVGLADLPPVVVAATVAATDPTYFDRPPLDLAAAAVEWVRTGVVMQAQSPLITELVATHLRQENPPLTPPTGRGTGLPLPVGEGWGEGSDSTRRALQDWLLGWQIEQRFGREQVLEWALNTTYYGHLAYGIDAAARVYFGKGATELSAAEAALLAAVARNPAANPFDAPDTARAGQAAVLDALAASGTLLPAEATAARAEPLALAAPPGSASAAPAFARLARAELERLLGPAQLARGGYQVETTLDLTLHEGATCLLAAAVGDGPPLSGGSPCPAAMPAPGTTLPNAAAVVILDPASGALLALAGDDPTAARPIGTLVRPFIYLSALSQGHTAASLTLDTPAIYLEDGRPYMPRDADGQYLGPLRLRAALAAGRAAPAVQVLSWVGAARVLENARALGLRPAGDAAAGLAFAARGFEADLLSLGHALGALGNGGILAGVAGDPLPRPTTIVRVLDGAGEEIYALTAQTHAALSPELAWLLVDMLRPAGVAGGEALAVAAGRAPGGDDWAIGLRPGRLVGVWASGAAGDGNVALPLWRALDEMNQGGQTAAEWPRPAGLVAADVCDLSGLRPRRDGPACPTVREWFVAGTEPAATDTTTREAAVNRETGRLATIFTPPHLIEQRVFTVYPAEAAAWAAEQGIEQPPAEYDTIRRVPTRQGGAAITSPEPWSVVGRQESPQGQWSVAGSAGGPDFAYYRLAYFPGLQPEEIRIIVERGETPVANGELGVWDTAQLEAGLYTLLLTVVRADGTFDEVAIPVTVTTRS